MPAIYHTACAFVRRSKPTVPFEEYDRQMDALVSLIVEKTGLPLYDLRDVG
jgi:hypothetical protein